MGAVPEGRQGQTRQFRLLSLRESVVFRVPSVLRVHTALPSMSFSQQSPITALASARPRGRSASWTLCL